MCPAFPCSFEGELWDLIVLISDHCFSIYFSICQNHIVGHHFLIIIFFIMLTFYLDTYVMWATDRPLLCTNLF